MHDKLLLQNMMFYGFHGVYEHERELGQRFYVDVELTLDMDSAIKTDDLGKTLDYVTLYDQVKAIVENQRFELVETLAGRIAQTLLEGPAGAVTVRVRKPNVPLPGQVDFLQVEVTRSK